MPSGGIQTIWKLEEELEQPDFTGDDTEVTFIENVYLKLKPLSGRELERAQQVDPQITHEIRCHYRATIEPGLRFSRGDRVLYIQSVLNVDERNRDLLIMAIEGGI